jgi:peptidoglycan-associated lipoprotein
LKPPEAGIIVHLRPDFGEIAKGDDLMFTTKSKTAQWLGALVVAAVLAGCGSTVPLDSKPVTVVDKSKADGAGQSAGANAVTPVAVKSASLGDMGPENVGRIVYFDFDSAAVKAESREVILAHARYLRANPERRVVLEGHTDERGSREYNVALGQRRAESVAKTMLVFGVKANAMESVSFGEEKPAMLGSNEGAWEANRRVEITYR